MVDEIDMPSFHMVAPAGMSVTIQAAVLPLLVPVVFPPLLLPVALPPLLDELPAVPPLLLLEEPPLLLEVLGAAFDVDGPSGVDEQPADSATARRAQPRPQAVDRISMGRSVPDQLLSAAMA